MLMELSLFPLGKGESVGKYVCRVLNIIDRSGIPYRTNAMGTILEGEWPELMSVFKKCFEALQKDCSRVEASVKIDYRKNHKNRLDEKIHSVERRLKRHLRK